MLYRQFNNFRELNLQTFNLYNVESKYKHTKERNLEEPLVAICYINHNMGLNLLIIGDKYEEKIKESILITNEDNFENIDFRPTKIKSSYLEELEKNYYQDIELLKTRSIIKIDEFRHADYPDDLEVLIPLDDGRVEQVWVRIKSSIDDNNYIGTLLHDSSEIDILKKNTLVKLVYHQEQKFNALLLDSIVE